MRKKIIREQPSETGLTSLYLVEEGIIFKHYKVFKGYTVREDRHEFTWRTRDKELAEKLYDVYAKDMN